MQWYHHIADSLCLQFSFHLHLPFELFHSKQAFGVMFRIRVRWFPLTCSFLLFSPFLLVWGVGLVWEGEEGGKVGFVLYAVLLDVVVSL